MKRKGFIFVETIVVLVVLSLALMFIYKAFYNVAFGEQRRIKYDNSLYLYRTYYIADFLEKKGAIDEVIENNNLKIDCHLSSLQESYQFCDFLVTNLDVDEIYLLESDDYKTNLNDFNEMMAGYLRTINDDGDYRLLIVFKDNYYASLKVDYEK